MALLKFEDLGPKTQDQIKKLAIELGFDANRDLFWERLSEDDKVRLKKEIDNLKYHPTNKTLPNACTPQMWKILYNEPEIVGTVKAAFRLGIISRSDRDELLQKIGCDASPIQVQKKSSSENKPFWNHREGKLYFNKKEILITQRRTNSSKIQNILQPVSYTHLTLPTILRV